MDDDFSIEMIKITKAPKPLVGGRYIVRTISNFAKVANIFTAYVTDNGSISVNNQKVTHISKYPL